MYLLRGLCLCLAMFGASPALSEVIFDTIGDSTFETVYEGRGANESLTSLVADYQDALTGKSSPILSADGRPLVVGSEGLDEDPAMSDQSQVQRFLVTEAPEAITVRYLGLGGAGFKSIFGAYYYPRGGSPGEIVHEPLFIQNVSEVGVEAEFTVPAGYYFGFYLDANGYSSSQGVWYSENALNSDNQSSGQTDHFLVFNTNRGILLAIEDLPRASSDRLGDQDYEDLLVGFITKASGEPIIMPPSRVVPEPGACMLACALVACYITHGGRHPLSKITQIR